MAHLLHEIAEVQPWLLALLAAALIAVRYTLFAGTALALVTAFRRRLAPRRIQRAPFTAAQFRREFAYSMLSVGIFASVIAASRTLGLSKIYLDPAAHGWVWLALSLPIAVLIHDTYFYWTHRFMHLPGVFERVHKVHHLSTNPSPLSALAFHPLEAVIEAGAVVVVTALIPLHLGVVALWGVYTLATNVMGHLGYELLPAGLQRHPLFGWLNTATSHNQHHRTFTANFGLHTLIWDRLMGTLHPRYADVYARTTGAAVPATPRPNPVDEVQR